MRSCGLDSWSAPRPKGGRLSDATSSYLLLHAEDAIDWHPWGEQALERARQENKLIFLSMGYASCHWCHVLARTTFADQRVVEMLNAHFISILVDQEERPDLDNYFMQIMLEMAGLSGSPANFFLTPDVVPLFAAGYLAPEPEYGAPGFVAVVQTLVKEWDRRPRRHPARRRHDPRPASKLGRTGCHGCSPRPGGSP